VALGAALYRASIANETQNKRMPPPLLGPRYSKIRIKEDLAPFLHQVDVVRFETVEQACANAASLIAAGRVIGWYRGRMEFGPRALGNRSILADPSHPEMRDRINAMVKKREAFRPFAPAVSLEQVHRWFDVKPGTEMPYMISIVNVRQEFRSQLPAITHVNGSARVQTVSSSDNPDFHLLLKHVGKATGREMVLNTSFNIKGQPIVNTPHEAIQTYLGTEIDYLFLENVRLKRRTQPAHGFRD
jgi:carbamoyltransferase